MGLRKISLYMSVARKIGSVALVLLIAASAVLVVSTCPQELATMNSDHDMAMMGMSMPGMESSSPGFSEKRTELCCQVSPADLPKQMSQVSTGDAASEFLTTHHSPKVSQPATLAAVDPHDRQLGPPPQALLCVFLI